jgi:hypothetical protein
MLQMVRSRYTVDRSSGTTEDASYFWYYGSEEGWVDGRCDLQLDVVSFDREERFCLLTQAYCRGNADATEETLRSRNIECTGHMSCARAPGNSKRYRRESRCAPATRRASHSSSNRKMASFDSMRAPK